MRQAIINNRHTAACPGPAAAAGGAEVAAWKINHFPALVGRGNSIGERQEPGGSACRAPANKRAENQQPLPAAATPSFPRSCRCGFGFRISKQVSVPITASLRLSGGGQVEDEKGKVGGSRLGAGGWGGRGRGGSLGTFGWLSRPQSASQQL